MSIIKFLTGRLFCLGLRYIFNFWYQVEKCARLMMGVFGWEVLGWGEGVQDDFLRAGD